MRLDYTDDNSFGILRTKPPGTSMIIIHANMLFRIS